MKRPCLLFASEFDDALAWRTALHALWPELDVRIWPQIGDAREVDVALVWKPPREALAACRNLRLIVILGAGGDAVIGDPSFPAAIPVARLVDAGMTRMMVAYVVLAVLHRHREFDVLEHARRERRWQYRHPRDPATCRVGVMGLGHLGGAAALALAGLGFDVAGWSRSRHDIPGVACRAGLSELHAFLERTEILVSLLPRTTSTSGLLDASALASLPPGAWLINVGRGATVDEGALLAALASGRLAGATLDVFTQEPLPAAHPFWFDERVMITPHQASVAEPSTAAAQVVDNVRRALAGQPLLHLIDRTRGY